MNTIYKLRALIELEDVLYGEQIHGTKSEVAEKIESIRRCRGKIVSLKRDSDDSPRKIAS